MKPLTTCAAGSTPAQPQCALAIAHASDVAEARRHAVRIAETLGFDETAAGKVAIVVTEAATNILKHAGDGQIVMRPLACPDASGVEILALDKGPGIRDIPGSLRDGMSTAGTAGNGLGAMRRLSDTFDVYSLPGKGTAIHLCLWSNGQLPDEALLCGVVCVPIAGEHMCGDDWSLQAGQSSATLTVVDGLGHGPLAAAAARCAVQAVQSRAGTAPAVLLEQIHQALRPTRGAAVAVMELDTVAATLRFAGVGNISASVQGDGPRRSLVSHNGIAGHNMRKSHEVSIPWPHDALVIAHSDGVSTQWILDTYPGLAMRHPALIAGILYRDFGRQRDDATVIVLRLRRT